MELFKKEPKTDFRELLIELEPEQIAGSKIIKVVKSCENLQQLATARRMVQQFYIFYGKKGLFDLLLGKKENDLKHYKSHSLVKN